MKLSSLYPAVSQTNSAIYLYSLMALPYIYPMVLSYTLSYKPGGVDNHHSLSPIICRFTIVLEGK